MTLMDIAALLGNFGEFVGAVAIVITLIYLAVQVRHSREATEANTKQLKAATYAEMTNQWLSNQNAIATSPDLARLRVKAETEGVASLAPDEWLRVFSIDTNYLKCGEFAYFQWRQGTLDDKLWEAANRALQLQYGQPQSSQFWAIQREIFASDFRDHMDEMVAEGVTFPASDQFVANPASTPSGKESPA